VTRARTDAEQAGPAWAAEVRRLAARRDAVILAHNYQAPEIQDVADHVGDSLALSRLAAASTASVIVFAESDLCCTSANAAQVVSSVPAGQEVLFLPDQFLGAHVRRVTGRDGLHVWSGECHVHAGISPDELRRQAAARPAAELFIHP